MYFKCYIYVFCAEGKFIISLRATHLYLCMPILIVEFIFNVSGASKCWQYFVHFIEIYLFKFDVKMTNESTAK